MLRFGFALSLLALAACSGPDERPDFVTPLARLAEIEDARDAASPQLRALAGSASPEVRARAALAVGRIMDPDLVPLLLVLASDANAVVRRTAMWSLGQYGFLNPPAVREPDIVDALRPALADREESVRAAAAEAIGKLAGADAPAAVAPLLKDPSARVRAEAAFACFRWRRVLAMRGMKDGDMPPLPAEALEGLIALAGDVDDDLRWRAAYVFAAVPEPRATRVLVGLLGDGTAWARRFAVRGLERAKAADAAEAIAARLGDPEHLVRHAAVGALASLGRRDLIRADLARDSSWHVRAAVAECARNDEVLDVLGKDPSPTVRAAALRSRVSRDKAAARPDLVGALASSEWVVREAAVQAAGALGRDGLAVLNVASGDASELVQAAVMEAAQDVEGAGAFALIKRGLESDFLAVRGTAVEALKKRAEPEVWDLLARTYEMCAGHEWVEVRESIVDVAKDCKAPAVMQFLLRVYAGDPAASVKRRAFLALKEKGVVEVTEPRRPDLRHSPYRGLAIVRNPVVVLETDRGDIVIECFPAEAPVHVANFVGLVKDGFYSGLRFHRVVSNFVVQGGDPLGNGWGDAGWHLRAEINGERYTRGTLGMPRTADFDTGGCQIFITHLPTPHLDGLYTVFGRVVDGMDVVDAIERGDRIRKARLRE